MQFRERRRVIQIIRTIYDPRIKRGRSAVIGRMNRDKPEISDKLKKILAADELAEVEAFVALRTQNLNEETVRGAAFDLAQRMRQAETYFRSHKDDSAVRLGAEIWTAWDDLKKAMTKAGCAKPKEGKIGRDALKASLDNGEDGAANAEPAAKAKPKAATPPRRVAAPKTKTAPKPKAAPIQKASAKKPGAKSAAAPGSKSAAAPGTKSAAAPASKEKAVAEPKIAAAEAVSAPVAESSQS